MPDRALQSPAAMNINGLLRALPRASTSLQAPYRVRQLRRTLTVLCLIVGRRKGGLVRHRITSLAYIQACPIRSPHVSAVSVSAVHPELLPPPRSYFGCAGPRYEALLRKRTGGATRPARTSLPLGRRGVVTRSRARRVHRGASPRTQPVTRGSRGALREGRTPSFRPCRRNIIAPWPSISSVGPRTHSPHSRPCSRHRAMKSWVRQARANATTRG